MLRELVDLGLALFHIFSFEVLLHDPKVLLQELPISIERRNDVLRLDVMFCQCGTFFGESDAVMIVLEEGEDQQGISP